MAQDKRKIEFRTQGSVAYDPSFYVGEEQAAVPLLPRSPGPAPGPKSSLWSASGWRCRPLPLWGWRGRC